MPLARSNAPASQTPAPGAARRAASAAGTLADAAAFTATYRERLGLRFATGLRPGEWGLVFSLVDPAAPEREFVLTLAETPGGYAGAAWRGWTRPAPLTRVASTVALCQPPLAEAPALLALLNAAPSANLRRFVAAVRAAFSAAARAGAIEGP